MKAIVVLMDSLNRHFLPTYGNNWVKTPNIDRFAQRSVVFDNHWIGSAPCMPARRDMLTGRINFLERGWGGLEPYDIPFPSILRRNGVYSHMETDHYHYFHVGGENYHVPFNTWALHRGQENDVYVSKVSSPEAPEHLGKWNEQYARNETVFEQDEDYPTPRTFLGAIDWLRQNEGEDDWLLWVEAFDPHEPFDCPQEYVDLYEDTWTGPLYNWSGYEHVEEESDATEHLRKQYAACLTMTDKFFGKLIEEVERQGLLEDTIIILTTDHGHMLGEHGLTGKNAWHVWNEMANIPLIVHVPGGKCAGERRDQLTQNVDMMPTLMEYFDVPCDSPIHGHSWRPILEENGPAQRETAIYGWFGQTVNLTDGHYTYFRAAVREDNQPLFRHLLTPTSYGQHDMPGRQFFEGAEVGQFLPWTDFPVLRIPVGRRRSTEHGDTHLYNIDEDYRQTENLAGTEIEEKYKEMLKDALNAHDSPPSQFARLGLT